eukprot:PhM_4_TR16481/c0_g1_i2/m.77339
MCVGLCLELLAEAPHLVGQISQQQRVAVLVHVDLVGDTLCDLSILQRRVCLGEVLHARAHRRQHRRARVATETYAEDSREHTIAIGRDGRRSAGPARDSELLDDPTKCQQRQVDLLHLFQLHALRAGSLLALGASEVHEVRHTFLCDDALLPLAVALERHGGHYDLKDRVGSAASVVHLRRGSRTVHVALVQQPQHRLHALHGMHGDALHASYTRRVLDLERTTTGAEQVVHLLAIDLEVAHLHLHGLRRDAGTCLGLGAHVGDANEQVVEQTRDDANVLLGARRTAHHRVRLPGASLSVRKQRRVVAVEHVLDEGVPDDAVHVLLRGRHVEAPVEVEVMHRWSRARRRRALLLALDAIVREGRHGGVVNDAHNTRAWGREIHRAPAETHLACGAAGPVVGIEYVLVGADRGANSSVHVHPSGLPTSARGACRG